MQTLGYIRDIVDVKMLVLFVMARVKYPANLQQIYELCFQDDCLSYFDICMAVPEMVKQEYLKELADGFYEITEKGRETGKTFEPNIMFTVRQGAEAAVDKFNRTTFRKTFLKTQVNERETGDFSVTLTLDDTVGQLMRLELQAPNRTQAVHLSRLLEKKGDIIYNLAMAELLSEDDLETEE